MKIRRSRKNPESVQQENIFFDKEKGLSKGVTVTQGESGAFFQPKLTVGRPGDRFEQQADATADAVVDRSEVRREKSVQRQAPAEEEEMAQARLDVQRQGLEEEEEPVQAQGMEEEEEVAQPKLEIRRQVEEEEEPVQAKPQDGGATLTTRLRRNRGRGNPLPPRIQAEMEGAGA